MRTSQTDDGQRLLTLWKLTAFEAIPADYQQNLTDIRKGYPGPEGR